MRCAAELICPATAAAQSAAQHKATFLNDLDLVLLVNAQIAYHVAESFIVVPKKRQKRRNAALLHDTHLPTFKT